MEIKTIVDGIPFAELSWDDTYKYYLKVEPINIEGAHIVSAIDNLHKERNIKTRVNISASNFIKAYRANNTCYHSGVNGVINLPYLIDTVFVSKKATSIVKCSSCGVQFTLDENDYFHYQTGIFFAYPTDKKGQSSYKKFVTGIKCPMHIIPGSWYQPPLAKDTITPVAWGGVTSPCPGTLEKVVSTETPPRVTLAVEGLGKNGPTSSDWQKIVKEEEDEVISPVRIREYTLKGNSTRKELFFETDPRGEICGDDKLPSMQHNISLPFSIEFTVFKKTADKRADIPENVPPSLFIYFNIKGTERDTESKDFVFEFTRSGSCNVYLLTDFRKTFGYDETSRANISADLLSERDGAEWYLGKQISSIKDIYKLFGASKHNNILKRLKITSFNCTFIEGDLDRNFCRVIFYSRDNMLLVDDYGSNIDKDTGRFKSTIFSKFMWDFAFEKRVHGGGYLKTDKNSTTPNIGGYSTSPASLSICTISDLRTFWRYASIIFRVTQLEDNFDGWLSAYPLEVEKYNTIGLEGYSKLYYMCNGNITIDALEKKEVEDAKYKRYDLQISIPGQSVFRRVTFERNNVEVIPTKPVWWTQSLYIPVSMTGEENPEGKNFNLSFFYSEAKDPDTYNWARELRGVYPCKLRFGRRNNYKLTEESRIIHGFLSADITRDLDSDKGTVSFGFTDRSLLYKDQFLTNWLVYDGWNTISAIFDILVRCGFSNGSIATTINSIPKIKSGTNFNASLAQNSMYLPLGEMKNPFFVINHGTVAEQGLKNILEFSKEHLFVHDSGTAYYINLGLYATEIRKVFSKAMLTEVKNELLRLRGIQEGLIENRFFPRPTDGEGEIITEFEETIPMANSTIVPGKNMSESICKLHYFSTKAENWYSFLRGVLSYKENYQQSHNESHVLGLSPLYDPSTGEIATVHSALVSKIPDGINNIINNVTTPKDDYVTYFPYRKILFQSSPHYNTKKIIDKVAQTNYIINSRPQVTLSFSTWGRASIKPFDLVLVSLLQEPYNIRVHPDLGIEGVDFFSVMAVTHNLDATTKDYTMTVSGERFYFDATFYPNSLFFGYWHLEK